jgi:hypothetical protein
MQQSQYELLIYTDTSPSPPRSHFAQKTSRPTYSPLDMLPTGESDLISAVRSRPQAQGTPKVRALFVEIPVGSADDIPTPSLPPSRGVREPLLQAADYSRRPAHMLESVLFGGSFQRQGD